MKINSYKRALFVVGNENFFNNYSGSIKNKKGLLGFLGVKDTNWTLQEDINTFIDKLKNINHYLVLLCKADDSLINKVYEEDPLYRIFDEIYLKYDKNLIDNIINENDIDLSNSILITDCFYSIKTFSDLGLQLTWLNGIPDFDPFKLGYNSYSMGETYNATTSAEGVFSIIDIETDKHIDNIKHRYIFCLSNENRVNQFIEKYKLEINKSLDEQAVEFILIEKIDDLISLPDEISLPKCKFPTLFFIAGVLDNKITLSETRILPPFTRDNINTQIATFCTSLDYHKVRY